MVNKTTGSERDYVNSYTKSRDSLETLDPEHRDGQALRLELCVVKDTYARWCTMAQA